jgi:hypothetical protein
MPRSSVSIPTTQRVTEVTKSAQTAMNSKFKKDLPNKVRRGHVETTRLPDGSGLSPYDYHDPNFMKFVQSEIDELFEKFDATLLEPCKCVDLITDWFECDDYVCEKCRRIDVYENYLYDFHLDLYQQHDAMCTYLAELASHKGSRRDGSTWRRKSTKTRLTRVQSKRMKQEHQHTLRLD